ncbi:DUF4270 domain-containing protein [Flavobacterium sp. HTF]|uniref:DUF4270 domain-containing protein n=1 Tax=Flavobacterium sp. HTF TaxID=2170732 RepID=UPI000D5DB944|nr:DUF4270 domain-containing protein [Flavobacterium sp. HTF]PWB28476.1 DUF4270 domain-containing protein [Flavobacterium sp. HTF]
MYNTSFFKKILLIVPIVLLYSCDKDFNAVGDDLIGDDHFGLESQDYDVLAYTQEITPVQSNGLAVNSLGIYDDGVFSERTASYATQVSLAAYAPSIGTAPVIKSVTLNIPYFSHVTATNTDGSSTYALDSIYGAPTGKIKLSVYESGVQMRSSYFDNGSQNAQMYYTDEDQTTDPKYVNFNTYKLGNRLNNGGLFENDEFFFSAKEYADVTKDATTGVETTTRVAPEMRLSLDKTFFQTKILNAAATKLSTTDVFQEYFRGLYFKVEKSGASPGNMALLDFSKGKINIKYRAKTDITTDNDTITEARSLVINLAGATAGLTKDVKKPAFQTALTSANVTQGDESLYLKGGQGSLAVIELNGLASKLTEIRDKKWLVNEANLVFHIDSDKIAGIPNKDAGLREPKRVYLYDLTNNIPIVDYAADGSTSVTSDPKMSKLIYSGIINVDATSKKGTTYKFRLTNHIRNIIKNTDAVNVKLGLVVTESISITASNKLKLKGSVITDAPRASVMSPLGTVLYGGKSTVPEAKRLKLEIYYTKPN